MHDTAITVTDEAAFLADFEAVLARGRRNGIGWAFEAIERDPGNRALAVEMIGHIRTHLANLDMTEDERAAIVGRVERIERRARRVMAVQT